jgi:DNA-directed RNA polymerase subunit F
LNPEYGDAYINLGILIYDKSYILVEKMNENLSDFVEYDRLREELLNIYREALPYFEKAYKFGSISVKATINNIYENLDMDKRVD